MDPGKNPDPEPELNPTTNRDTYGDADVGTYKEFSTLHNEDTYGAGPKDPMGEEHESLIPNTNLENPKNINRTGTLVVKKNDYNDPVQEETRPEVPNDPHIP